MPYWLRYGIGVALSATALIITVSVPGADRHPFFTLFTVAVAISTWIGGRRSGILALLLSVASAAYLFARRSHVWSTTHDIAQFSFFVVTACFVVWITSALQKSQQQLRAAEARVRTLAEAVPQLLWSTDAVGNADYLSQQWLDYTGQTLQEAMASGWQNVLHPEERDKVVATWRRSVESGNKYEIECRLRRFDGTFRWMLARGVPQQDESGRITHWFGTCTDIHDQKTAEELLRRAEKLAATGRLASTMAHEINNPLESITNLLYLAKNDPSLPDGSCRDFLVRADQEVARVTHMVRQTLGLFRGSPSAAAFTPSVILDKVLEFYAGKIAAKDLRVERDVEGEVQLRAVQEELEQVLATLLANAIDASPIGGSIRLRIRRRRDWSRPERHGVCICVADQGPGISSEDRHRIFEPFFTTKKDVGTGLALWAAKGIVERWGGWIRYRSINQPSRSSTTFSVFIPAAQALAQASKSQ
jgi:PAS domain S-box-containing protein